MTIMTVPTEAGLRSGRIRLTALGRLSERKYWPYLILVPALVLVGGVVLYPMVSGLSLSFREMRLNRPDLGAGFVGLKHYVAMWNDPVFWLSLVNTLKWVTLALSGEFALGLLTALLLNRGLPGSGILGVLVLLPWFLPSVVAGNMWALMLDARIGIINELLVNAGFIETYKAWFADPTTAMYVVILVEIWHGFPFFALLLLAGLKAIPQDLYDAAACDGAGPFAKFRLITLPQLNAIIAAAVILRSISLVNSPEILLIMTGGGPGRSTQVLSLYAYLKAQKDFNFGYASALAVVMLLILVVFSYAYIRVSKIMRDN